MHSDRNSKYSLAYVDTTPVFARYGVIGLILLCHAMFFYGQLVSMWRLYIKYDMDVWVNSTSRFSGTLVRAIGLNGTNHFFGKQETDVRIFTYGSAIEALWDATGLESTFVVRLSAVLLVLFSGIWPHVKLYLLSRHWLVVKAESPIDVLLCL